LQKSLHTVYRPAYLGQPANMFTSFPAQNASYLPQHGSAAAMYAPARQQQHVPQPSQLYTTFALPQQYVRPGFDGSWQQQQQQQQQPRPQPQSGPESAAPTSPKSRAFFQDMHSHMGSMVDTVKGLMGRVETDRASLQPSVPSWCVSPLSHKLKTSLEGLEAACHFVDDVLQGKRPPVLSPRQEALRALNENTASSRWNCGALTKSENQAVDGLVHSASLRPMAQAF